MKMNEWKSSSGCEKVSNQVLTVNHYLKKQIKKSVGLTFLMWLIKDTSIIK